MNDNNSMSFDLELCNSRSNSRNSSNSSFPFSPSLLFASSPSFATYNGECIIPYDESLQTSSSKTSSRCNSLLSYSSSIENIFGENAITQIPNQKQTKKHKNRKKKTKTKTKRKKSMASKHRNSKKKTSKSTNIKPARKYIAISDDLKFSYSVQQTSLRTEISLMVENSGNHKLKKVKMKWYQITNRTKTYLLAKKIEEYDYNRRIVHLYNDSDDYKYKHNELCCRIKYTLIGTDEWEDQQVVYNKSRKFKIKLN